MNNFIEINSLQLEWALSIAKQRMFQAIGRGYKDNHGYDGSQSWDIHINGAAAEIAYSKYVGEFCSGAVGAWKGADHGSDIQIRWTGHENGRLIVRPGDNPEHKYVLLADKPPRMRVIGEIKGFDAMQDKYHTNFGKEGRPKVWAVPQLDLSPIERCDHV